MSKVKRGASTKKQLSGEALTVLDQSAARKARYQVMETKQGNKNKGRTRR